MRAVIWGWVLVALPGAAWALPEFAVRSAAWCDTCHEDPKGGAERGAGGARGCTLNCSGCHVDPTGGGLRTASGLYYQTRSMPMFDALGSGAGYQAGALVRLWSRPDLAPPPPASGPTLGAAAPAPGPGTPGRYGGLEPNPDVQIGANLRLAFTAPTGDGQAAFFPMQSDLSLAVRPYNPRALDAARVTALVQAGVRGARDDAFDGVADRAFVRTWWVMLHDLPYRGYARAGRFLPAHGWRLDDHTALVRSGPQLFGAPQDFERQVTGVEVGLNPNSLYVHASGFLAADDWADPFNLADGGGGALSVGWRDRAWHVGLSAIGGISGDDDGGPGEGAFPLAAYSVQWALNPQVWWPRVPLIYLGELQVDHSDRAGAEGAVGLSAFHELSWWITQGLDFRVKYHWRDPSTRFAYDTQHRADVGLRWYPLAFLEVIAQYRHRWLHTDDRFAFDQDTVVLQLHAFY